MRILLYAPVDLNVIDGSAIWVASVAQMLAFDPTITCDILLDRRLTRNVNIQALGRFRNVHLLDPWTVWGSVSIEAACGEAGRRLKPAEALDRIRRADARAHYELIVLRGADISRLVAEVPELSSRSWFYLTGHTLGAATARALSRSNGRFVCQTPLVQLHMERLLGPHAGRYVLLPPMVPRVLRPVPRTHGAGCRLFYAGKFEPNYMVDEMLDGFSRIRTRHAEAEFWLAGDKFYDPDGSSSEYRRRLEPRLTSGAGVHWKGGLPRQDVADLMVQCDLGSCWRSEQYDDSLELSTKVLEYAAAGLPVLLNPTRINRLVFGDEYPLYTDGSASFLDAVQRAFREPRVYEQAASTALRAARDFTFDVVNRSLQPALEEYRDRATQRAVHGPTRIVFAGHDLKFLGPIIEHFTSRPDCVVRLDRWSTQKIHDERSSEELLRWADAIWCEWCCGNAVWYSRRVRPHQRLVVRLHRFESLTDWPEKVRWENVRHLIFIAPQIRDAVLERLNGAASTIACMVDNVVECDRFRRSKKKGAELHLGLLGYVPKLKHPRLAVEILNRLVQHDDRWRLYLAGRPPQDYRWIWNDPTERSYYEEFESYFRQAGLESYIVRQAWTDDTPEWFSNIGVILSCSDLEGSHQAVAEGMASAAMPVVRKWDGAAQVYARAALFDSAEQAAEMILESSTPKRRAAVTRGAYAEAIRRFDPSVILPRLESLLLGA